MRIGLLNRLVLPLLCLCGPVTQLRLTAADVLTQHNNNARTGAILDETVLKASTVNSNKFGKLWTLYTDGQVVAQPLYVSNLAVDTSTNPDMPLVQGTFNAVVIATMHNTIYVYDADRENAQPNGQNKPLWAKWLGKPRGGTKAIDMWSTNDPEWGILSTPVISNDKKTLYAVAWHEDAGGVLRYRLHALDLKTGLHRQPPVVIGAASNGPGQPCRNQSEFNPCTHKQRAALLLDHGRLYIAFGGDGNRGAMFVFDAATLNQITFWSSTPDGKDGGIWQSGQGPAADPAGDVYLMIGNGAFNANTNGGQNYGSSFVRLRLEGQNLVVKDYFTPCNQKFLTDIDLDVGSAGPMLVPDGSNKIVSGGKEGVLYVVPRNNMGHHIPSNAAADCQNPAQIQSVKAFPPVMHNNKPHYGNVHGSPVFWKGPDAGRIYAWGENSKLKAYTFTAGKLVTATPPKQSAFRPPDGMPGGMLAISANGAATGSGIVWAVVPLDGDANTQRGVKGILLAIDAQDVTKTLWTSEQFAQRDRLGLFAKFSNPMIAAGKVFVATYGDQEQKRTYPDNPAVHPDQFPGRYYVAVYGPITTSPPQVTVVNQDKDDITVLKATTSPLMLNTAACQPADAGALDCTAALSAAAQSPSFHKVLVAAGGNLTGCSLLRVTTASKTTAIANSTGIGFYTASFTGGNVGAGDMGLFIVKDELRETGTGTLKGGAAATFNEFAGITNCPAGAGESSGLQFKPYMQFEPAGPNLYRNWDVSPNYRVNAGNPQLDRSAETLQ